VMHIVPNGVDLAIDYIKGMPMYGVSGEHNAEFIVRACNSHDDLLAACRIFMAVIGCRDTTTRIEDGITLAHRGIAKAEGA
jgi:hypothetical protein